MKNFLMLVYAVSALMCLVMSAACVINAFESVDKFNSQAVGISFGLAPIGMLSAVLILDRYRGLVERRSDKL